MSFDKERILSDLKNLGLNDGDAVALALSFKSMGVVKGGPKAFIDALLTAVGTEGTVMVNTFTDLFPLSEVSPDYVFKPSSAVPNTGLIPRLFLKLEGVIRSQHPVLSVAVVGRFKKYLTEGHDADSPFYLPYERLAHIKGKYLFIGIGNRMVGVRHESQIQAGLWIVPLYGGVQYANREGKQKVFVCTMPPCTRKLDSLVPLIEKKVSLKRGKIGNADSILVSAEGLIEAIASILKQNPTLNLCSDIFCLQCRELERRLCLYDRISNPRLFQRNLLLRRIISLTNAQIMRSFSHFAYSKSARHNARGFTHTEEIAISVFQSTIRVSKRAFALFNLF